MQTFLLTLRQRNPILFGFGVACWIAAVGALILIFTNTTQVQGVSAWLKPFKFFVSTGIFMWTMGWIMHYLNEPSRVRSYSIMTGAVLAFEVIYIAWQAALGQLSHFNISDPFHSILFSLMGVAITILTAWTGYITLLFLRRNFPDLPGSYLWGIRLGLILFVIFAFEGGLMASMLRHTVGAADGGPGLPLTNWSINHGDLRIAHFIGMHALQLLPLIGWYVTRKTRVVVVIGTAYAALATFLFIWALLDRPL